MKVKSAVLLCSLCLAAPGLGTVRLARGSDQSFTAGVLAEGLLSQMLLGRFPGGYEPVTIVPVQVSTSAPTPGGTATPATKPLPADIKFSVPLQPGMFVTYWTSPVSSSWSHSGGSFKIGTPFQKIPGLAQHLVTFDKDQDWYKSDSSRRGKVKILTPTKCLHLTFGLTHLKHFHRKSAFVFHFVVRDSSYDTILDSGSKIVTIKPAE